MKRSMRTLAVFLLVAAALGLGTHARADEFSIARIYIEYNASANDLGFHVTLDGENWKTLRIVNPRGRTIFEVEGTGPYRDLGMTELFFEGAEPNLADFPLDELLALMPEGDYKFIGRLVDEGGRLISTPTLSHAVPAGPTVSTAPSPACNGDTIEISWTLVDATPAGFPDREINVTAYQVIVESFQVTLPGTATSVTVPPEFFASLEPGTYPFEVLAIDVSGNQTLTEGTFVKE